MITYRVIEIKRSNYNRGTKQCVIDNTYKLQYLCTLLWFIPYWKDFGMEEDYRNIIIPYYESTRGDIINKFLCEIDNGRKTIHNI